MTFPTTAVVTTNLDASTDSPATARSDILDAVQKLNQMIAHTSAFAATLLDDANDADVRITIGAAASGPLSGSGITGAAASGANTDITSIDGVTLGRGPGSGNFANTRFGKFTLGANTSGSENTSFGYSTLGGTITGNWNTAIGSQALYNNTAGSNNTAVGQKALYGFTGTNNTAIGAGAMAVFSGTGGYNTALGDRAMFNAQSGSGNIGIGSITSAGTYAPVLDITTQNNCISMGHTSISSAYIQVGWTTVSDARDKVNFAPVPHGLDFVNGLNPIAYQFKVSREDDTPNGPVRYGFKAQEVLALEGNSPVIVDNKDAEKLRFTETYMIPILVNAIQELTARVAALEARV